MNRIAVLILFLIIIMPLAAAGGEVIEKGQVLSLEACLDIALKRHPDITAAASAADAGRSKVEQARANYYPQIEFTAGYSRTAPIYNSYTRLYYTTSGTDSGLYTHSYEQYTGSAALTQNIYDFGKTSDQVKVQQTNYSASVSDLENMNEKIVYNVKQAYYGVLQARRNRNVSADTVRQFQQHLEQAKGFYAAGTKPKFDVTKAEVDLSNARLNLIKTENALKLAMAGLSNAMGIPDPPEYDIEDSLSFKKIAVNFEDAISAAYKNRPDLKAALAKKQSAEASVDLAKKGFYPALTGSAAYNWSGNSFPLDNGWNIGASLSIPIFSGFLTKNQVEEARANLKAASANEDSLRQTVLLEVQQAFLNLSEAEERIPAAELTVRHAQENYDIATGRYAAGVGNPIEVTDAEAALLNAKMAYIQALSDYKLAQAGIEKAMGTGWKPEAK